MLRLQTSPPRRELREFVRIYAQRETDRADAITTEPCPARLEQMIEFEFGNTISCLHDSGYLRGLKDVTIIGAVAQPCKVLLPGGAISFGIFFQPTGLSRLFGIPMAGISLDAFDSHEVAGSLLDSLHDQLAESDSFAQRVSLVEQFLLQRAARVCRPTPIQYVAAHVFAVHGLVSVNDIARQCGLGLRQFERKFREHTGMAPKLYSRIARFQSALDAKIGSPHVSWLEIAHSHGYHDQMHMIRDFHNLAGDVPGTILSSIGDMRPPALNISQ